MPLHYSNLSLSEKSNSIFDESDWANNVTLHKIVKNITISVFSFFTRKFPPLQLKTLYAIIIAAARVVIAKRIFSNFGFVFMAILPPIRPPMAPPIARGTAIR